MQQRVDRPLFERVMSRFIEAGAPADGRFRPDIGDRLVPVIV